MSGSFPFCDLHKTEPATPKLRELRVVAEARDINIIVQGCLEYVRAFGGNDWFIIDNKMYDIHFIAIKLHFS